MRRTVAAMPAKLIPFDVRVAAVMGLSHVPKGAV